jgi:hypothetical protein
MGKIKPSDIEIKKVESCVIEPQKLKYISFTIELLCYDDLDGMLSWHGNILQLAVSNKSRRLKGSGFYYFRNLKKGVYQMQVIFRCGSRARHSEEEQVLEKKWTRWVAMPFIEFHLV